MLLTRCKACGCNKTAEDRVPVLQAKLEAMQEALDETSLDYHSVARHRVFFASCKAATCVRARAALEGKEGE